MSTLFFGPARWKHKTWIARFARNLIGGTAIITANHLDFFVKDNISTALWTINLDLHDLSSHIPRMDPITRLCPKQAFNGVLEYWSAGKSGSFNFNWNCSFITPLLHYSITPANCRMRERLSNSY
jgi:hypothetical protein